MRIRTKLALEIIILVSLIGMVSFIALINTKQVQDTFVNLSDQTLPILDSLTQMRQSATQVTTRTMEILLLEEESKTAQGVELAEIEEELEIQFYQIEKAKSSFNQAYSQYSNLMDYHFPNQASNSNEIAEKWNDLIIVSNTMIKLKTSGASGNQILSLSEDFHQAQQNINNVIDLTVSQTAANVSDTRDFIDSLVSNTTLTIFITLNVFIAASLGIRYMILKSISNPLQKLRKTTHTIATGEFIKNNMKGDDEISDLARDIDSMSSELYKLNKTIVANERLSSIGNLASRLAHDLRNPLSVIKNSIEIMKVKLDPIMDEKTSHQMAMVGRAVARMTHQIDDVLDYVNVAELQMERHSLSTIIESSILNTAVPSHIHINLPKNSASIYCDAFKLEIVFSNMINNAIQAIDGEGSITFRIHDKDDYAIVEMEDSGPGIPESAMAKIFEPLFTTKQIGTGLGLASCKSIIEKHGGTIEVSNHPTTFTIMLPKTEKAQKTEFEEATEDTDAPKSTKLGVIRKNT